MGSWSGAIVSDELVTVFLSRSVASKAHRKVSLNGRVKALTMPRGTGLLLNLTLAGHFAFLVAGSAQAPGRGCRYVS